MPRTKRGQRDEAQQKPTVTIEDVPQRDRSMVQVLSLPIGVCQDCIETLPHKNIISNFVRLYELDTHIAIVYCCMCEHAVSVDKYGYKVVGKMYSYDVCQHIASFEEWKKTRSIRESEV